MRMHKHQSRHAPPVCNVIRPQGICMSTGRCIRAPDRFVPHCRRNAVLYNPHGGGASACALKTAKVRIADRLDPTPAHIIVALFSPGI
jgi:hypothetical protein